MDGVFLKIGILTWFFANNYGARAHTYALRNTIEKMGYTCEFINYVPEKAYQIDFRNSINCDNPKKHPLLSMRCIIRCIHFWRDRSLNPVGKPVYAPDDIKKQGYDLVIIGSDAIFNLCHPLSGYLYYGVGIDVPYAMYAPSVEYMRAEDIPDMAVVSKGLNGAEALSVRDSTSFKIISDLTEKKVKIVLDPTFLWDFHDIEIQPKDDNYILVYCFSDWNNYSGQVRQYAAKKGFRIISIGKFCSWADKNYDYASFRQWLGFFAKAEVVFTDSFHGACFGIKNRKQIIFASRSDKRAKIQDLLNTVGMDSIQFYQGDQPIAQYMTENFMDYEIINQQIEGQRRESMTYLRTVIQQAEKRKEC